MNSTLICLLCVAGVTLIFYIIALVKSKRNELVFTTNGWDMAILLLSPLAFFIVWCIGFKSTLTTFQIVLIIISAACILGSFAFSIVSNKGNWWHITISILAKVFTFILTTVILLIILIMLIFAIISFFASDNHGDDDEVIIFKYDKFLHQYVGCRYIKA